jgi:hypothetical protein
MSNCRLSFSDRLRRGIYKKQLRAAQPPITNDNRTLNNNFFTPSIDRALCRIEELCAVIGDVKEIDAGPVRGSHR